MRNSLRETLVESHVARIAIAMLLLWSTIDGLKAVGFVIVGVGSYLVTAILILDIPSAPSRGEIYEVIAMTCFYTVVSLASAIAAYVVSFWVFGVSPARSLRDAYMQWKGVPNV